MADVNIDSLEKTPAELILHRKPYTEEDTDRMFEQLLVGDRYFTTEDKALVRKAYALARDVYHGQKRHTGDSFIYHLFDVMSIVVQDIGLDAIGAAAALLHDAFHFWWTGFYRVVGEELGLGPFQGPIACVHIAYGRGVCGTAWKERRTVVVPDVEQFPGHIACSSESRSEIVVPVFRGDEVIAVLDIDSAQPARFTPDDARGIERLVQVIERELHDLL